MTNLQKTIFIWGGVILMVFLVVFLAVNIDHVSKTAATTNTVSFDGEGKITAKPDVAVASLTILTEAATSKDAQNENSDKSQKVTDFLKKQAIDEKDIKTTGYNIYPQYNYPQNTKPTITGYQVNQTIEVKIRNLDNVSKILDGVTSAGVNQINSLQFEIDKPDDLKAQARQMAIDNAKKKADELKSQLGISLGRIVNFQENTTGYPGPIYYSKSSATGMGGGGPDIPTGENEITVDVTLTYQIK